MFSVLYGKARLCEFNNLQILFLSTLVYYITAVKFFWVFVWYVIYFQIILSNVSTDSLAVATFMQDTGFT